jgi:hypothetical protein
MQIIVLSFSCDKNNGEKVAAAFDNCKKVLNNPD